MLAILRKTNNFKMNKLGIAQSGLERCTWNAEAVGSNPTTETNLAS